MRNKEEEAFRTHSCWAIAPGKHLHTLTTNHCSDSDCWTSLPRQEEKDKNQDGRCRNGSAVLMPRWVLSVSILWSCQRALVGDKPAHGNILISPALAVCFSTFQPLTGRGDGPLPPPRMSKILMVLSQFCGWGLWYLASDFTERYQFSKRWGAVCLTVRWASVGEKIPSEETVVSPPTYKNNCFHVPESLARAFRQREDDWGLCIE